MNHITLVVQVLTTTSYSPVWWWERLRTQQEFLGSNLFCQINLTKFKVVFTLLLTSPIYFWILDDGGGDDSSFSFLFSSFLPPALREVNVCCCVCLSFCLSTEGIPHVATACDTFGQCILVWRNVAVSCISRTSASRSLYCAATPPFEVVVSPYMGYRVFSLLSILVVYHQTWLQPRNATLVFW